MKVRILLTLAALLLTTAAIASEPMAARIRVSNGALYDYAIVGENVKASDGFDNAYDTISPGNLNADMGAPYISVVIRHPEWKAAYRELRGDIRAVAKRHEWQLTVTSSLPKGALLEVALLPEESRLPQGVRLFTVDQGSGKTLDLRQAGLSVPAPGPGGITTIHIISEQNTGGTP